MLSHQKPKLKEGRHNWALLCSRRLTLLPCRRLPNRARESAANKNPAMETDDKELPEDLDDVTMIADPDDEVDNESG